MSEFRLTGSDVFGRYCLIEQLRFYAPNEMYLYKVVASLRSNCWCDVPYKAASKEVLHDSIEDCVLAIRCGVDETEVLRFRVADVEFVSNPICDRDALLALADELDKDADNIISAARNARFTGGGPRMGEAKHDACEWRCIARRIREALGMEVQE